MGERRRNPANTRGDGYLPIEAYGAIGNLRTVTLVGRNGCIDWCCLPRFDSPSLFGAILDHRVGGRFRVSPEGAPIGRQRYIPHTNVLETSFEMEQGRLVVTDWMPLRGDLEGVGRSAAQPEIRRLVRCESGPVTAELEWSPRFDYARADTRIEARQGGAVARAGDRVASLSALGVEVRIEAAADGGPAAVATLRLSPGDEIALSTAWDREDAPLPLEEARACLHDTCGVWQGWVERGNTGGSGWTGEWRDMVTRSALALKLMIHGDSGAIVAAPTTSLPEEIGGIRNWDYRYSWIRDAAQTADALLGVGHGADARDYVQWAERVARANNGSKLEIHLMYSLDGEPYLPESELEHLEGYRRSKPVRIGNAAAGQRQLDIYGELLDAACELARAGEPIPGSFPDFLREVADAACLRWHKPDHGIWEARVQTRHYVHSKVMIWVALARAMEMHRRGEIRGSIEKWSASAAHVKRIVLERGFDPDLGAFVQAFGSKDLDAANLLIPIQGFLPASDPRVQGTIDRTLERLTENDLVYRYRAEDGLAGEEGAFGLCTFWMIDALILSGRLDEAGRIFENMAARANHVGLYSEEIDPASGIFLGNFPQAYTHIGLINSVLYFAHAEGRELPVPVLSGTPEHMGAAIRAEG